MQRAEYLRAIAIELRKRESDIGQIWPRESGVLQSTALQMAAGAGFAFDFYADKASSFHSRSQLRRRGVANSA